jgi:MSHA pilin protein MshA
MFKKNRGFTLIELVIIIVVLGILASIAIPKYKNIVAESREAAARGALGAMRSGISIYYANAAVTTGNAIWPELDSIGTVGVVMEQAIPRNPYQLDTNAPDSIVTGVTKGEVVGTRGGWAYLESTGEIWLNTGTEGENNW